jgi:hypothetical protein
MLTATQIAGFVGAGLAGAAYVPQIWHLARVHCSAGISRMAFVVWLLASFLVTTHAVATEATVFMALGSVQIAAITLILVYATKYRSSFCAGHILVAVAPEAEPAPIGEAIRSQILTGAPEQVRMRVDEDPNEHRVAGTRLERMH